MDSIAFGVGLRFNGQSTADCHKKHEGAQKVKSEGMNQLCDVVRETSFAHVAQLLGYLESSRVETGLLVNFGAVKLHVKSN